MKVPDFFGFYAILTNPLHGYEYVTELMVSFKVPFVQLRMKDESENDVALMAKKLRRITERTCTKFIINDYPHIARDCGADGVHIGQGDQPYNEVRELVGPDMIIGISTHSPLQTKAACELYPDYIGVGPVFATPTKKTPDPVIGIDGMREMLAAATVPAVVIGGINLNNLPEVLSAGAKNFCMVRQVNQADDPKEALRKIALIMEKTD